MTLTDSTQTFTARAEGKLAYFLYTFGLVTAIVIIWLCVQTIAGEPSAGRSTPLVLLVGLPAGLLGPILVCTTHVRIKITPQAYSASLWPLSALGWVFGTTVPWENVRAIERRTVKPFREYGGWGVKGKPDDLLYSVGGTEAVTVHYHDSNKGRDRMVTVTTPDADALYEACLTHTNPT